MPDELASSVMSRSSEAPLESLNMRLVGHSPLGGIGDGMHVNVKDDIAFVGHMGNAGTSLLDVSDPSHPEWLGRIPAPFNTRSHKVQIVGDTLLVNRELLKANRGGTSTLSWTAGLSIYDVADPRRPREIGFWSSGGRGVHRMTYWSEPYAYVTTAPADFDRGLGGRHGREIVVVLDLSDVSQPKEVGRWWVPGTRYDESDQWRWGPDRIVKLHHGIPRGDRLYCGWEGLGIIILDVSDPRSPEFVSQLDLDAVDGPSSNTHTACPLPGREVLVATDEAVEDRCQGIQHQARLIDISDDTKPRVISRFPIPEGDYCDRGGRFGPHNVHEGRPGTYQSGNLVFMTYFNAGVRVYDVSDAENPAEVAYYVPPAPRAQAAIQLNDILVTEDRLVYVTDRDAGGLYILEVDDSIRG